VPVGNPNTPSALRVMHHASLVTVCLSRNSNTTAFQYFHHQTDPSTRWQANGNNAGGEGIYYDSLRSKLARTRTEVLSISQGFEDGASGVETRKGDAVAAPGDLNTPLLQGEEGDHGENSDGAGEGGRGDAEGRFISMEFAIRCSGGHSLVVLGPPAQVAPPDIVVEDKGNRNGGPNIGHVVRSPDNSTK